MVTVHARARAGQTCIGGQETSLVACSCADPRAVAAKVPRVTPRTANLRVSARGASTAEFVLWRPPQVVYPWGWCSVTETTWPKRRGTVFPASASVSSRVAPGVAEGDGETREPVTDPHPAIITANTTANTPDHLAT